MTRVGTANGDAADKKVDKTYLSVPLGLHDVFRMEPGDTTHTTEDMNHPVVELYGEGGSVAELIRLQTVVDEETLGKACAGIMTAKAVVGTNPEATLQVLLDRGDAVVSESLLGSVMLQFALLEVVAVKSVVGSYPQSSVEHLDDAARCSVVETVLPEGGGPAVFLDVETADTHGGGNKNALAIGRDRHLRDIVVDDTVGLRLFIGESLHGIGFLHGAGLTIDAQESLAHGAHPQFVTSSDYHRKTADILVLRKFMVAASAGIDIAKSLAIATHPDAT